MTATPYEALVESASRLVETEAIADLDDHNIAAAAALVERNRPVLDSARRLLGHQCSVPVRYEHSFLPGHVDDFSHLRNLARAFRVESLLAASRDDYAAAALVGVDMLELANAARRGGLIVDLLVGNAISGVAVESLRKFRAKLDETTRRTLRTHLERLEDEREPYDDIYARDQAWEQAVGCKEEPREFTRHVLMEPDECGLSEDEQQQILQCIREMVERPEADKRKMQHDLDHQTLAMTRLLRVDSALRSWYASTKTLPNNLAVLVPQYLEELPPDPFTGDHFIYRPVGSSSFVLYSTGPKKCDGGGSFGHWSSVAAGHADLCLDADEFWED
jgi:hypothetical protein